MKLNERIKKLSKKQKVLIATVTVLVVLGGSFGYKAYADGQVKKQVEQAQVLVDEQSKEIKDLQTEIKVLFNVEKTDFLNEDVTEETLLPIKEKLNKIEKNYDSIVLPTKEVKTKDYSNHLSSCKESIALIESMLVAQKDVNRLFGKTVISGDTVAKNVAIKDDLKADTVKKVKDSFYNKEIQSEWQEVVNSLLDNADDQLKQIEKSKQALEKVYKDNKVINTDQKNYDSAKSEIDKIINEKMKKELADKLANVKEEIDKKAKEEAEKTNQSTTDNGTPQVNEATQSKANGTTDNGNAETGSNANANNNNGGTGGYTGNGYTPSGSGQDSNTGGNGGGYTPPADNGGGSTPTPTPTPEPTKQYVGWWNDGVTLHSAGTFGTEAEALAAAKALYIQNGRVGSYGASEA